MQVVADGPIAIVVNDTAAPRWMVILTGLLAFLAVLLNSWFEHLDTAVHEGGHALATYLAGGEVRGVWIEENRSGYTTMRGYWGPISEFVITAAGYVGPSVVGLCSASLLGAGNVRAVFILAGLALAFLLLVVRNGFGIFVVMAAGASLVVAARYAPGWTQLGLVHFLTWFLLFSGPKSVLVLHRARRKGASGSDADDLAALTHLPGLFWVLAFGFTDVWCGWTGAGILLS